MGSEYLGGFHGGGVCDALYLARIDIYVDGFNMAYMVGFDLGDGRVYSGLPIAGEGGR